MYPVYEDPEERQKRKLEKHAFARDWKKVIRLYKKYPYLHTAKITASGDTALHLANSESAVNKARAEEFISFAVADGGGGGDALKAGNEFGNTPLHMAAFIGKDDICTRIAGRNASLIGKRNKAGETPLFLAVRHGWIEAFRVLNQKDRDNGTRYAYFRAIDG